MFGNGDAHQNRWRHENRCVKLSSQLRGVDHSLYTVSLLELSTSSMKSHEHGVYFQFTLGSLKPREFLFEFINRFHLNKGCYGMLHTPLKCNLVNFDITIRFLGYQN